MTGVLAIYSKKRKQSDPQCLSKLYKEILHRKEHPLPVLPRLRSLLLSDIRKDSIRQYPQRRQRESRSNRQRIDLYMRRKRKPSQKIDKNKDDAQEPKSD